MQPSIFTKIINGEIPAYKIYEDDKTIVILDIHPVKPGHLLVIPKVQIDHFENLPDDYYQAVWATVKIMARHLKQVLGHQWINVSIVGTDVPHTHVHLIPFDKSAELRTNIDLNGRPDEAALALMAAKLMIKEPINE